MHIPFDMAEDELGDLIVSDWWQFRNTFIDRLKRFLGNGQQSKWPSHRAQSYLSTSKTLISYIQSIDSFILDCVRDRIKLGLVNRPSSIKKLKCFSFILPNENKTCALLFVTHSTLKYYISAWLVFFSLSRFQYHARVHVLTHPNSRSFILYTCFFLFLSRLLTCFRRASSQMIVCS